MSRKWIAGLVALVAVAATALAAAASLPERRPSPVPSYHTLKVDPATLHTVPQGKVTGKSKPKLTYLESSTPTTINPADAAQGGIGPYVDVKLTNCSKVISGGVVPISRTDVFVQGSYVSSPGEYHVLIAIDPDHLSDRTPFTIRSNLTCLKGVGVG
jgi:ABC-type transport system substrate-binding protein